MGELINLRQVRKAAARAKKEQSAASNRITYGTPKHLRKAAKAEKLRMKQTAESHKLDPHKQDSDN